MTAIRKAIDSGRAGPNVSAIYDLLNRAGEEKSATKGAALIRKELPIYIDRFLRAYPTDRARVSAVKVKTLGGRVFRQLALRILSDWSKELPRFRDDVARSAITWFAVVRFGKRNNASERQSTRQLKRLVAKLPAAQRKALMLAIKQTYGV
jgi:hypothetical protein